MPRLSGKVPSYVVTRHPGKPSPASEGRTATWVTSNPRKAISAISAEHAVAGLEVAMQHAVAAGIRAPNELKAASTSWDRP